MRKRVATTFILLLVGVSFSFSQEIPGSIFGDLQQNLPGEGTVRIYQDSTVSNLMERYILHSAQNPGMNGYRIRIFFALGKQARKQSEDLKSDFLLKYQGIPVYQSFNNPYWKISVGDFRSRESAQKFYHQLLSDYPKAFLVNEWINFPTLQ